MNTVIEQLSRRAVEQGSRGQTKFVVNMVFSQLPFVADRNVLISLSR